MIAVQVSDHLQWRVSVRLRSGGSSLFFRNSLLIRKRRRSYNRPMASVTRPRSQEALRRALEELKNSESKLRQVIDTIPTLAWCNLPDGSNEFLNKRWHEYTGLSAGRVARLGLASCDPSRGSRAIAGEMARTLGHQVNPAKWKRVSVAMTECFAGFS